MKPTSLLLFLQPDKKILEVSDKFQHYVKKIAHSRNLQQNSLLNTLCKLFLNSSILFQFEASWTR